MAGNRKSDALASAPLLAVLLAAGVLLAARPALAATFTVDRTDDPDPATAGACTAAADNLAGGGGVFSVNNSANPGGTTLNITDSTVSGNSTSSSGGGVRLFGGTANITNSTISGNQATRVGSLLASAGFSDSATMNINNSTIANASFEPSGGIRTGDAAAVVNVKNSIVSNNDTSNCDTSSGGTITSRGNNISGDDSCPFAQPTDKRNTNPRLGPLANNGGPTDTHALLPGSPAVDTGAGFPAADQRGQARPRDGDGNGAAICDIGAFEKEAAANGAPWPRTTPTG